jgi:hypothetical protein
MAIWRGGHRYRKLVLAYALLLVPVLGLSAADAMVLALVQGSVLCCY